MTATTLAKVRFGAFELDPSTGELWRDGVRVPLQEHPFRVLLCLIERQGEVVSREELVAQLWPGTTFIDTEVGLNTAVRKLRIALDDDSDAPRYIETLPRRGYRLLVPVETVAPAKPAAVPRASRLRWGLLVALLLIGVSIAWWRVRAPEEATIASVAHAQRPPVLLLLPFEVPRADDPLRPRIDGIAETLRRGLGSLPGMRVSAPGNARTATAGHVPDPREYDADIALLADVRGAGESAKLRVQLRRPGAPRAEWSKDYALAFKDLSVSVANMQNDIAQRVLVDPDAAALHAQLTSLETGESLRAGDRAYEGGTRVEDWNDAIVHFEQALRRDADNPRAWCRLSRLYMQWIWTGQKSVEEALAKALPAIARGTKQDPALDDCLAAQAEVAAVQGKMEEGRALMQRLLEIDPDDGEAQESMADYAMADGEIARGRKGYERVVRAHPDSMYTWYRLIVARAMEGDDAGARAGLQLMHDAWPELAITHHAFGLHAEIANDHAAAVRHQERAAAADPTNATFGWAAVMEALEIMALDRAQAGLHRAGAAENRNYVVPRMWLFIAQGEPARAVAFYRSQRLPPSVLDTTHGALGLALALSGDRKRALAEFKLGEQVRQINRHPISTPFPHSLRLMFPENLAALLPAGSPERKALVRQLIERDAFYRKQGGNYALLDYVAATHAALDGRTDDAFRLLDVALARGFSSAFSLRRDLAWMELRDDPRLKQRQARLDAIAAAQREVLRERGP